MKKRILALALAGTTAFSVFGAAMSAGAADSTHTAVYNDAYVSYDSVAKTIKARAEKAERSAPDVTVYDVNTGKLAKYEWADLYNIEQLLHDIYALNCDEAIYYANTSEMVYLMQRYVAREIVAISGDSFIWQGAQVIVSKNAMKTGWQKVDGSGTTCPKSPTLWARCFPTPPLKATLSALTAL